MKGEKLIVKTLVILSESAIGAAIIGLLYFFYHSFLCGVLGFSKEMLLVYGGIFLWIGGTLLLCWLIGWFVLYIFRIFLLFNSG
jgi:hypothetical protein